MLEFRFNSSKLMYWAPTFWCAARFNWGFQNERNFIEIDGNWFIIYFDCTIWLKVINNVRPAWILNASFHTFVIRIYRRRREAVWCECQMQTGKLKTSPILIELNFNQCAMPSLVDLKTNHYCHFMLIYLTIRVHRILTFRFISFEMESWPNLE